MTEELKMSKFGINFVNADEGGLRFRIQTNEGEIRRRADTIEDVAHWVTEYGVAAPCYFSSTMDFAAEEGFADDDGAVKLFDRGVALASEVA